MDEYIRADNDFRQRREEAYRFSEMTRGFGGRVHSSMSDQSIAVVRMMTKEVSFRGHSTPRNLRGNNKALLGRQLQGAEAPGASEEDMGINPGRSTAYFVVKTRATIQDMSNHHPKAKRDCRSRSPAKSTEAGPAHCFVAFTLHTRICG